MTIPDKVKIGGIMFDVVFQDEISEREKEIDGRIIYDKQIIRIKSGMAKEYTESVFLHEVLHGIVIQFQIDFGDNEERNIERLAYAIYQVLKDNDIDFRRKRER